MRRLPFNYVNYDPDTDEFDIEPVNDGGEFVVDGGNSAWVIAQQGVDKGKIVAFELIDASTCGPGSAEQFAVTNFADGAVDSTSPVD